MRWRYPTKSRSSCASRKGAMPSITWDACTNTVRGYFEEREGTMMPPRGTSKATLLRPATMTTIALSMLRR
jgi:hypothetical protein